MITELGQNEFTENQQTTLREVAARLASGHSLPRVAWLAGVSESDIKCLLSGKPLRPRGPLVCEDAVEAIAALAAWLESEKQGAPDDAGYASTPTFDTLQSLYAHAHQWRILVAVTGAWGIGKSEAARYYAANHPRTHDTPGTVRIQFDSTDRTLSAALAKIAEHLNIGGHAYRNGSHMGAIEAALRPGDLLILDECQLLGEAIDVISDLHDATGAAIVMQGNPDLSGMIWGKSTRFSRLASRANRYDFPQSTPDDVDAWLAWRGAGEGMTVAERKKLTETACLYACKPAQNGGLRALADSFRAAETMYGQKVDAGILATVAAQLKPDAPGAKRGKQ